MQMQIGNCFESRRVETYLETSPRENHPEVQRTTPMLPRGPAHPVMQNFAAILVDIEVNLGATEDVEEAEAGGMTVAIEDVTPNAIIGIEETRDNHHSVKREEDELNAGLHENRSVEEVAGHRRLVGGVHQATLRGILEMGHPTWNLLIVLAENREMDRSPGDLRLRSRLLPLVVVMVEVLEVVEGAEEAVFTKKVSIDLLVEAARLKPSIGEPNHQLRRRRKSQHSDHQPICRAL